MKAQPSQILIADDDNVYCIMLRKTLRNDGHSVLICNSGEEAIDLLKTHSFSVILLDYKMKGINGIEVLQWMYNNDIDTPVILITGHGSEEVALDAWKWRAHDYFVKGKSDLSILPKLIRNVQKKVVSRGLN